MLTTLQSIITAITLAFLFSLSTTMSNSLIVAQVHVAIVNTLHKCIIMLVDEVIEKIKIITIKVSSKLIYVIKIVIIIVSITAIITTISNKALIILFQVVALMY